MLHVKRYLEEKYLYLAFEAGVILKGIHAILEIVGGIVALFVTKTEITNLILFITQEELGEDPKDVIARYLVDSAQNFSVSFQHFISLYLLSHGIIKLILVAGLFKKRPWAYPASISIFSLFIIYQLYRFSFTHSPWLLLLTALDGVLIFLTWHQYRRYEIREL